MDNESAFPTLSTDDVNAIRPLAEERGYADGSFVFKAGNPDVDFFVVISGEIEIVNPTNNGRHIVTHKPGQFSGDIDLLTRRPVVVNGIARGHTTLLRVPGEKFHDLLNRVPRLGETLLTAFQTRRALLAAEGNVGLKIIGPSDCKDTTVVREFLHKNFVPFTWVDSLTADGKEALRAIGSPKKTPAIICNDGKILLNPSLRDLANCAGVWRGCHEDNVDLAIVGAGPAGIAAAVYAASEGLKTIVLDRIGPGGQASGSSKIENFIGFPAGLSGTDLATRGVLQMLKFGAKMIAPITVERLEPAASADAPHVLHLDCGTELRAQVVLVATGVNWRRLDAKGMDRFERSGIYYACTTVEADMHEGQDVAVVGAGNSAGQAAMFLAERCARKVYLIIRKELGPGMSEYLSGRIRAAPNIEVLNHTEVVEIHGDARIRAATLKHHGNGSNSQIDLSALFVFIGAEPQIDWLPQSAARDKLGYLLTGIDVERSGRWPLKDRTPCPLETTIPRVLAAGDVRAGSTKRVGFAVGDGSLAVTCSHRLRMLRV
jgi:thioredoxin reductase (NADPH)